MTKDKKAGDRPAPLPENEALLLAAYLDGRLDEQEAASLEARLAGEAALLDELLALRQGLAPAPQAAGAPELAPELARVVARAQALVPPARKPSAPAKAATRGAPAWIGGLLAQWLRPAVPAFAVLTLLLASVGAFELGRYQAERQELAESTGPGSDVPVDLLLGDLL